MLSGLVCMVVRLVSDRLGLSVSVSVVVMGLLLEPQSRVFASEDRARHFAVERVVDLRMTGLDLSSLKSQAATNVRTMSPSTSKTGILLMFTYAEDLCDLVPLL